MNGTSVRYSPTPSAPRCCARATSASRPVLTNSGTRWPSGVTHGSSRSESRPWASCFSSSTTSAYCLRSTSLGLVNTSPRCPSTIMSMPSTLEYGRSTRPITVGIPMARARIATWELPEPNTDTRPTSLPSGTSPSWVAVNSSLTKMVLSGKTMLVLRSSCRYANRRRPRSRTSDARSRR